MLINGGKTTKLSKGYLCGKKYYFLAVKKKHNRISNGDVNWRAELPAREFEKTDHEREKVWEI